MRVEVLDNTRERRILTALITSGAALGRIKSQWDGELFDSPWANLVAGWCTKYHARYGDAPGREIQALYEGWASRRAHDKETARLVEQFLASLSDEYEQDPAELNVDLLIDQAGEYFNRVRAHRAAAAIQGHLQAGETDLAVQAFPAFRRVELGVGAGVDLFMDQGAVRSAFDAAAGETLITMPGDLGDFYQGMLERDAFIGFMAPQKSSKSMRLMDLAYRAMCQRRKVAFFQVGDLSERQVKKRIMARAAAHPTRSPNGKWPCVIKVPREITVERKKGEKPIAAITFEERRFDAPLDQATAWAVCQRVLTRRVKSTDTSYFKLAYYPTLGVNVDGVKAVLAAWQDQGWAADVVVVDYADNLAPCDPKLEKRDQINDTWARLRQLSETIHCLVLTATQVNAASYDTWLMDRRNFAEDNRKFNHVTGMIGINVTSKEKERGVCRLNWIALREGDFSARSYVHCADCLGLAHPCVLSSF